MKRWLVFVSCLLALCGGLFAALHVLSRLPSGPVPIIWDKEACAHCHMHVGEPRFAAQLQTKQGDILNFDDPGCLLQYRGQRKPDVHAIYFHDLESDRWLKEAEVGFVPVDPTPMGYNLGAVPKHTPSALSMSDASQVVLSKGTKP